MSGIAAPEIVVLFALVVIGYGIAMTLDAARRPQEQYRYGPKLAWLLALIALNPLLTRFVDSSLWLASLVLLPVVAIAHHVLNVRSRRSAEVESE